MPDHIPPLDQVARSSALRVLASALDTGPLFAPLVLTERSGGLLVTISVHRDSWTLELSPCERAILSILECADRRWSTTRVLNEMDRAGLVFGEGTVKRCLSSLVKAGYLTSSRVAPCGYAIKRTDRS